MRNGMSKTRTKYKVDWHTYSCMCDTFDEALQVARLMRVGKEGTVSPNILKVKPSIIKVTLEHIDYDE